MGLLKSNTNHTGLVVNNVILGDPVELDGDPTTFEWDDSMFPNGVIDAEGNVVVEGEVG